MTVTGKQPLSFTTVGIDRDTGRVLRWVGSAASDDKLRPVLMPIQIKAPLIQATDGFVVHRATFDNPERLSEVFDDGLYKIRAIHPGFVVLEKVDDTGLRFPDVSAVWREPDQIRAEIKITHHPEGPLKINAFAQYATNPRFLMRALSIKNECPAAVITFGAWNHIYHVRVGYIESKTCGTIRLEAIIVPMHSGGAKGISITDMVSHE